MKVVGTMFFKNNKLLIDKPRKRPTYQMIGGKLEKGETLIEAAIRECHEELGEKAIFDENKFEQILDFYETATSDPNLIIHFHVFKYNGKLSGILTESEEIEKFLWYETSYGDSNLSYALNNVIIPYCKDNKLIK